MQYSKHCLRIAMFLSLAISTTLPVFAAPSASYLDSFIPNPADIALFNSIYGTQTFSAPIQPLIGPPALTPSTPSPPFTLSAIDGTLTSLNTALVKVTIS